MEHELEQVHPEVVNISEQIDFFGVARRVLPWVLLAFVLFRVGSLFVEYRAAQDAADRIAAQEATSKSLTAASTTKTTGTTAASSSRATTAVARGPYVVVLIDGVNFHSKASNGGKVIDALKRGAELSELGREGSWLKLKDSKGRIGYVFDNPKFVAHKTD